MLTADAVSYAASTVSLLLIRARETTARPGPRPAGPEPGLAGAAPGPAGVARPRLRTELLAGLSFGVRHPVLRKIAACTATANLFAAMAVSIEIIFLVRVLHVRPAYTGVLVAAARMGGVAAGIASGWLSRWIGSARIIWVSMLAFSAPGLLLPLAEPGWRLSFVVIGGAAGAFSGVLYNIAQLSYRQAICPPGLLGRLNAAFRWIVWGTLPLGSLAGGALGTLLGVRTTIWIGVSGTWAAALWVLFSPLRRMRDVPGPGEEYGAGPAPGPRPSNPPGPSSPPDRGRPPGQGRRAWPGPPRHAGDCPSSDPGAVIMPMPVIDAHHHLWDLSAHDQPWIGSHPGLASLRRNFTVTDLEALAAEQDVIGTVLVQTVSEPWETPEMLALAATGGLVAGVVGWVDLESPDVAGAIAALRELPGSEHLAGIRHPVLFEPDANWLTRPAVLRGLAAVSAAGLTCDLVAEPRHLPAAAEAARAVHDLQFVLDHLGNPDVVPAMSQSWAEAFRALAALPNVAGKLSGIFGAPAPGRDRTADADGHVDVAHMRPYYEIALQAFGPQRLMFGSDWPVSTLHARYADIHAAARALTAGLSATEQESIFSGTARRIYRLRRPA